MLEQNHKNQFQSGEADTGNPGGGNGPLGELGRFIFDFLKVFVIAVAIIVPIRLFLFQPFVVTGDSMQPNFIDGDYLIIDEITYRFRNPERGDVLVLRFPNDPSQFFIKRIIGLPGERVVVQNGSVAIVDQTEQRRVTLNEEYLPRQNQTFGNIDLVLAEDEYFVLGDNRLSSSDSRIWGTLKRKNIIGRAFIRAFPIEQFQIFTTPSYSSN